MFAFELQMVESHFQKSSQNSEAICRQRAQCWWYILMDAQQTRPQLYHKRIYGRAHTQKLLVYTYQRKCTQSNNLQLGTHIRRW